MFHHISPSQGLWWSAVYAGHIHIFISFWLWWKECAGLHKVQSHIRFHKIISLNVLLAELLIKSNIKIFKHAWMAGVLILCKTAELCMKFCRRLFSVGLPMTSQQQKLKDETRLNLTRETEESLFLKSPFVRNVLFVVSRAHVSMMRCNYSCYCWVKEVFRLERTWCRIRLTICAWLAHLRLVNRKLSVNDSAYYVMEWL